MELKDFVKTALIDLITGIDEAKKELGKDGSLICPPIAPAYSDREKGLSIDANGKFHQKVEFDIAVAAGEEIIQEGKAAGKLGIKVLGMEANLGVSVNTNNLTVSRIKFHVPIGLQCMNLKEKL